MPQNVSVPVLSESFPARVYVEPTNACNLTCRTCVRNVWQEPAGWMESGAFDRILGGIRELNPRPTVFFGGFGEPLAHPRIVDMVASAQQAGSPVELITNGVLLSPQMTADLAEAGLNRLWVSIDGATPQSYADVRLGAALPEVIANLESLREQQLAGAWTGLKLGIAFVAMRRNVADLPEVIRMGRRYGADRFSISNVLPYTPEMQAEILYRHSLYKRQVLSHQLPHVDLPPMDRAVGVSASIEDRNRPNCPFLEKKSMSIRWDGEAAPCLPLLHRHSAYLDDRLRQSVEISFGNVRSERLMDIWRSAAYRDFRARLASFDFSPCVMCNACEMADANLEDCFGNPHPTCGGCLWAEGFIRCP